MTPHGWRGMHRPVGDPWHGGEGGAPAAESRHIPGTTKEPEYDALDARKLRLFRDGSGRLRLTIQGDRCYLEVKVVSAFPLSDPDRYINFLDSRDGVIGLVAKPEQLDSASRKLVAESLDRHYFMPTITRIRSLKEQFGAVYFDVDTDRGGRHFVVKGIRDAMVELGDGELLIPDADGNRYRIADWRRLDTRSRRLLERIM